MVRRADGPKPLARRKDKFYPVVYRWLKQNSFNKAKVSNFTLLDSLVSGIGGKIYVPPDRRDEFVAQYAKTVENKFQFVYFSERLEPENKDKPRRLYFDLDLSPPADVVDKDEMQFIGPVLLEIFETVRSCCADPGDSTATAMFVLSSGLVEPNKLEKLDHHKMGYHLVWPMLLVNQTTHFAIRRKVVLALGRAFNSGDHKGAAQIGATRLQGTWADIVDLKVIQGQNLRAPYSRKCKQNTPAKNEKKVKSCVCGALDQDDDPYENRCLCYDGCLDIGRPYLPFARCSLDHTGHPRFGTEPQRASPTFILQLCLITVPFDSPLTNLDIDSDAFREEYSHEVGDDCSGGKTKSKHETVAPELHELLDNYCRLRWPQFVSHNQAITATRSQGSIAVAFHSTRCPNATDDCHGSSTSYLTIFRDGLVVQNCWSKKTKLRRFSNCGAHFDHPTAKTLAAEHSVCCDRLSVAMQQLLFKKPAKGTTTSRKRKQSFDTADENSDSENDNDKENRNVNVKRRRSNV